VDLKVTYQGKDIESSHEFHRFEEINNLEGLLKSNLSKMKFSLMTPIQKAVIPYLTQGQDVMGMSQTGSGKTVAFLLPILNKMLKEGYEVPSERDYAAKPVTLILVPTRELADQIFKEARKLVHNSGIDIVKVYGGVSNLNQSRELRQGCDVLVAAPGRLLDFLRAREISLSQVKYLILDEADRMLDMGFEPQLKSIIYEFDLPDKLKRQNLMFSATFEPEVKDIARKFMNEVYFVHTNTQMKANSNVEQLLVYAKENEKIIQLHKILQTISGSIISKSKYYYIILNFNLIFAFHSLSFPGH
jgi:superfamily II DNA/RNA helicase